MSTATYEDVFKVAGDLRRVLIKTHPHAIVDCLLLAFPRRGAPWGTCCFCEAGLPLLKSITDDSIKDLLEPMSGSDIVMKLRKDGDDESHGNAKKQGLSD